MFILALVAIFAAFAQASALNKHQQISKLVEGRIGRLTLHSDAEKFDWKKIDLDKVLNTADKVIKIYDIIKNEEFSDKVTFDSIAGKIEKFGSSLDKVNSIYAKVNAVIDALETYKRNKKANSLSDDLNWDIVDSYLNKLIKIRDVLKSEEEVALADAEKFKIGKTLKKVGKIATKGAKIYATTQGIPAGLLSKKGLKSAVKGQLKDAAKNAAKNYARKHGIPLSDSEKFKIKKALKKVGKVAAKGAKIYATSQGIPAGLLSKKTLKSTLKGQVKSAAVNAAKNYARKHGVPLSDAQFKVNWKKVGKTALKVGKIYAGMHGIPIPLSEQQ